MRPIFLGASVLLNIVLFATLVASILFADSNAPVQDGYMLVSVAEQDIKESVIQYNCSVSGGIYNYTPDGGCDCRTDPASGLSFSYDTETGFCVTPEGTPAGEIGGLFAARDTLSRVQYRGITKEQLPDDIHPAQITKVIDNYALVVVPSFNIWIPDLPSDREWNFRGVLMWNDYTGRWEKFLQVEDIVPSIESGKHNPVDLWFTGMPDTDGLLHLQVVDTRGAGSGEGVAKVFVPTTLGLDTWKLTECFEFAHDIGKGKDIPIQDARCTNAGISLVNS